MCTQPKYKDHPIIFETTVEAVIKTLKTHFIQIY